MGKQKNSAATGSGLGLEGLLPDLPDAHPIKEAVVQVEKGLMALRKALMEEAQLRAGDAADGLRKGLLDAESSIEKLISLVPGVGPVLAMGLYRATHTAQSESESGVRPSNDDDMPSHKQLEPGGVASSAYLEHVGLA